MNVTLKLVAAAVAVTSITAGSALAADSWICAVASAVAVDEDGTVGPPDVGDRERPTFFRIDAAKKELTLLAPQSRRGEITKLETVREVEGAHLFSAVENGRCINLLISAEGRVTLSVVSDGVVWSVFGHALKDEATK